MLKFAPYKIPINITSGCVIHFRMSKRIDPFMQTVYMNQNWQKLMYHIWQVTTSIRIGRNSYHIHQNWQIYTRYIWHVNTSTKFGMNTRYGTLLHLPKLAETNLPDMVRYHNNIIIYQNWQKYIYQIWHVNTSTKIWYK